MLRQDDRLYNNASDTEKWRGRALGGNKFLCSTEFCSGNVEGIQCRQPKRTCLRVGMLHQGRGRRHDLRGPRKELLIQQHFRTLPMIQGLGQYLHTNIVTGDKAPLRVIEDRMGASIDHAASPCGGDEYPSVKEGADHNSSSKSSRSPR